MGYEIEIGTSWTLARVFTRRVWRALVLLVLLSALTVGAIVGSGRAAADVNLFMDADDDTYVLREFSETIAEFTRLYPKIGPLNISVEVIPVLGVIAATDNTGQNIYLEEIYTEQPEVFTTIVNGNIAGGYFPTGCTPARLVAIHEFGHVIDNQNGRIARTKLQNVTSKWWYQYLPKYSFNRNGTLNPGEALANAFAAVHCGSANPVEHILFQHLLES